jgi:hypothetical protein
MISWLQIDGPHLLRGLYEHDMPLAKKFVYMFDRLLARKCSRLRAHIKRQGLSHTAYSFRYLFFHVSNGTISM